MYYMRICGWIPEEKEMEYTQMYKLAFAQLPSSCRGYRFVQDPQIKGVYDFITFWDRMEQAESFSVTPTCVMLAGAAATLGKLLANERGEVEPYESSINSGNNGELIS